MVQLDKLYKDKRAKEDLVNKKYLYQQNVDRLLKGEKNVFKPERKWSEKLHKWVDHNNNHNNNHNQTKIDRSQDNDDCDESESDSDSDDDIPIAQRI